MACFLFFRALNLPSVFEHVWPILKNMNRLIGAFMASSRAFKTLTALLAAMTVGVFLTALMQTSPIVPIRPLAAVAPEDNDPLRAAVMTADEEIHVERWQYVVVRTSESTSTDDVRQSHFVISPSPDNPDQFVLRRTPRWTQQLAGRQLASLGNANRDAIGVCIIGDFSQDAPTERQFEQIMAVVRMLQDVYAVSSDRVYLPTDENPDAANPGRAFPIARFHGELRP
jgi:hypothetical protein